MKNTLFFLLIFSLNQRINAQITEQKAYFQQEANYKINAKLDDIKHRLTADIELEYKNNSTETLTFLYLLLPANAYSSQRSAFAKQELAKGKTRFYFADPKEMGNFSNLNIQIDGKRVEVEIDKNNPDVAKVKLARPISAGETVKLTTPYQYKIPALFSRGGHVGQQYLMTQWYPRVAVFDRDGWHPQPYLDQGEFYAEFGTFDVTLTLPENYVVGATGVLETASERDFLAKKAADTEGSFLTMKNSRMKILGDDTDSFPKSASRLKTIHYTAEKVIDFAWFADKRFMVVHGDTTLKSGRKVDVYGYFAPKFAKTWDKATTYLKRVVGFYSEHVGEYPHPQASAVMADEGFGGGMEYPMITVLSGEYDAKSLDILIAHEVGHNWFQGILASNERDHAWMDEGLNTYHEKLYSTEFYGNPSLADYGIPRFFTKGSDITEGDLITQIPIFEHKDQAPETTSNDLTSMNYLVSAYQKPAMSLSILAKHLGPDKFEELMHRYFDTWKFKHPQPADFRKIWTDDAENVGDVSWFFDGLIGSTGRVDYAITDLNQDEKYWKATVKNVGKVAVPFTVSGMKGDSAVYTTRLAGVPVGEQTVVFIPKKEGLSMITVDFRHLLPEANRANNNIRIHGFMPKVEPLRVKFAIGLDNSRKTNIYVTPIVAANVYDNALFGAWIHNGALPLKSFEFSVAPMYSTGTKSLAGLGNVNYAFFSGKNKVNVGINARSFASDFNKKWSKIGDSYNRVTPSVSIEFRGKPTSNFTSKLQFRYDLINEFKWNYDSIGQLTNKKNTPSGIAELSYSGLLKNALGNLSFKAKVEQQSYKDYFERDQNYIRATVEVKKDFMYQRNRRFTVRGFMGGFLTNTREKGGNFFGQDDRGSLALVKNGFSDYRYDDLFIGRSEETGGMSQQIDPSSEGGMKFVLPTGSTSKLGYSNSFVASLNMKIDLPVNLPRFLQLKPYFDIGYFADKRALPSDQTLLMSGGIAWELLGDAVAIYFPVYFNGSSDDPNSFYSSAVTQRGNYRDRITFSVDLKKLNPLSWMKAVLDR